MMTRPWRCPPADGYTVHVITDTHIEDPGRKTNRVEAIRTDMRSLLPATLTNNKVTTLSGDLYHNMYSDDAYVRQRPASKAFLDDLAASDGTPQLYAVGNHELWGDDGDGDHVAAYFGYPQRTYSQDHGPLRFIVYSPKNNAEIGQGDPGTGAHGDWTIPAATLDWIEDQIDSTPEGMHAVMVSHCPPLDQFGYLEGFSLEPRDRVSAIMAKPKLVAWFTGHLHHWPSDPDCFKVVSGTALIHGLSCGGTLPKSQLQPDHPVESVRVNASVFATYFPPGSAGGHRWECRVRDHDTRTWGTQATGYQHLWTLPLPDSTVAGEMQAAAESAMAVDGSVDVAGEVSMSASTRIKIHVPAYFTVITSYSYLTG